MDVFQYVLDNKEQLLQIVTGIVTVASLIANLTKTDSDNAFVAKVSKLINLLALNVKK